MDILQALFLGVLQGLTEWLPVSSSAHLALAQLVLGMRVPVAFDVALHLGTLLAVFLYFRKEIFRLSKGFLSFSPQNEGFRYALLILLAMIPTAFIGFAFKSFFERMFYDAAQIGVALLVTGVFLFLASKAKNQNKKIGAAISVAVGIAQGIAVAPGISRSGSTISIAMLFGVSPEKAARFSFLLGIPAILGASFFELQEAEFAALPLFPVVLGILASAVAGYLSIAFFMDVLKRAQLHYFAYYCWFLGLAAISFSLL